MRRGAGDGLFWLLWGLGWLIWKVIEYFQRDSRQSTYQQVAGSYAGAQVSAPGSVERDLIQLPGPPCPARLRFYHHRLDGRIRNYTEFTADIDWRGGAMRVSTPEWAGALDRYYGGRDVQVGDGEFDGRFLIQGNPETLPRELLNVDLRNAIYRLDAMGEGPMLLQLRPRQLLIRVSRRVQEGDRLRQFIDDCYAMARRLVDPVRSGEMRIEAVAVGADAECQVCGTKIDPPKRVLCRKCRTPSHKDCWDYNDGCSVFACGERGSVRG